MVALHLSDVFNFLLQRSRRYATCTTVRTSARVDPLAWNRTVCRCASTYSSTCRLQLTITNCVISISRKFVTTLLFSCGRAEWWSISMFMIFFRCAEGYSGTNCDVQIVSSISTTTIFLLAAVIGLLFALLGLCFSHIYHMKKLHALEKFVGYRYNM